MSKVTFMGHGKTKGGLQSDREKVKAIAKMAAPTNVEELRRYLRMVNYLAKFMPHMTDVIYLLRSLTKHDVTWTWSDSQQVSNCQTKANQHNCTCILRPYKGIETRKRCKRIWAWISTFPRRQACGFWEQNVNRD